MTYVFLAKPLYVETPLWPDARSQDYTPDVDGAKVTYTGLVDKLGNQICRMQDRIGFHIPNG
jgi:hypothetical protein